MRFYADGPAIPDVLLEHRDAGRVVFLCGAGVSQPSGMPDFVGLTRHVIKFFDPAEGSEIMRAFKLWIDDSPDPKVPLDQVFNLLHQEYGRDQVNAFVTQRLTACQEDEEIGHEHGLIKRISSSQDGAPQIVTTNFDTLFEIGGQGGAIDCHVPPALPDPALRASIEGITYLHGRLNPYVLSSADFGRAYLSEAWATDFVRKLLNHYTVVLVGYQAEDPPIRYLLQGLNHEGQHDSSRLYVFDKGQPEDIEAKWRDRGATAIAYVDHNLLWQTMEAWATRADNPRDWRASVISSTECDPKSMAPHERGQVAHVLRARQGARLLAKAGTNAHPEWICVLDADVRSAKPGSAYGEGAGTFDPQVAYGLDDDLQRITDEDRRRGVQNDDLLLWRSGDDNPHGFHRLGGRQAEGYEATPARLRHLIVWITKSVRSPVLAWWAARKKGLHPRLIKQIASEISGNQGLHDRARHIWHLILESHSDPRNRQQVGGWFAFKKRIAEEGWTPGVLRDFRRIFQPRIEVRPPSGIGSSRPPTADWDNIRLADDIGRVEVKFPVRRSDRLMVSDAALPKVLKVLEDQLAAASGILSDVGTTYFTTPTCYPGRDVVGKTHSDEAAEILKLFFRLFNRMSETSPELARAHVVTWPETDRFHFRKLKLYGLSKKNVFEAAHVVETVLSFDQDAFWDRNVARELLFLLVDRWTEFSTDDKSRLTERILQGPDKRDYWSDEEFPTMRDEIAARYGRYLETQGCDFTPDQGARLTEIIATIPEWQDGLATSLVTERGVHIHWVAIDNAPDVLMEIPVSEVAAKARADLNRDVGTFTEKRPFRGLVEAKPRKALLTLAVDARTGEHTTELWSAMIEALPENISPRLKWVFLQRLARLPKDAIKELRHSLGLWLVQKFVSMLNLDEDLAWLVYDHVVEGILHGGEDAAESGISVAAMVGQDTHRSRRTLDHAINGPIGKCAETLFIAVAEDTREEGSLFPDSIKARIELLFSASGDGGDHAVAVTMQRLNWLMHVDPEWTKDVLVPMLGFDHPASEPAWSGFLNQDQPPLPALTVLVKPLLLDLHSSIDRFGWDEELSEISSQWLGWMRIFRPDQPDGLTKREMRSVLRSLTEDARNHFIHWLGREGQRNDEGWMKLVVPFIEEAWPKELKFRTSSSTRYWLGLLEDTGDSFPAVYSAVKAFLVPVEPDGYSFFGFTDGSDDEEPVTTRFPRETLDLLHVVTPGMVRQPSYELPRCLELIVEADCSLASDPRYRRLIDLVEQS